MSSAAVAIDQTHNAQPSPWIRETIDSFAVALILAFLFRAFVAEAFVIPTGSMAPTLMGAHKDVVCSQCGFRYQGGASSEFDNMTGALTNSVVIGTTCPICRFQQPIDTEQDANQKTFSGDRILVSKLAYVQSDPQRWQVIVFKYPREARQNYIKRLIGLPNETIHIEHGDIYVKKPDEADFSIARKPPNILEAMLQPVADTDRIPPALVKAGLPSAWQPAGPINTAGIEAEGLSDDAAWKVQMTPDDWQASLQPAAGTDQKDRLHWLRYYHYVVNPLQWYSIEQTGELPTPVIPRTARLISDFSHYNAMAETERTYFLNQRRVPFDDFDVVRKPSGLSMDGSRVSRTNSESVDGIHWVGDLAVEFELTLGDQTGELAVDLVEAGVHYQLALDTANGGIVISAIENGSELSVFDDGKGGVTSKIVGSCNVRGSGDATIRFANVDDTLTLWVDGTLVELSPSNRVLAARPLNLADHRPRFSLEDAGDAAPAGIAATSGMQVTVNRARVWRDIYYTSIVPGSDYENQDRLFVGSLTPKAESHYFESNLGEVDKSNWARTYGRENVVRDILFSEPTLWEDSPLFAGRKSIEFQLADNQYFPMGDNSSHSADARSWTPNHFVHRDLMIGRAVLVFWPHYWNSPIPYWPNFGRMGIIR